MDHIEAVIVSLLVAVAVLSALATRIGVPYPILLVLGGLGLGFVPGVPDVRLQPELVLVVFLPPLLYSGAFFANLRELKADLRTITLNSTLLVVATAAAVAVAAHALIDGLPWAVCFALGAIVAPTDPLAATAIARRYDVPRRAINILEGESLINDASALVIYKIALGAVGGGAFSLLDAGTQFVGAAAGGIAIGLAAAVPSMKPADSSLSASRMAGSCRPMRTNRIALSRKVSDDQSEKSSWRTFGVVISGAHHPSAMPAVTAATTPDAPIASAGTYAA